MNNKLLRFVIDSLSLCLLLALLVLPFSTFALFTSDVSYRTQDVLGESSTNFENSTNSRNNTNSGVRPSFENVETTYKLNLDGVVIETLESSQSFSEDNSDTTIQLGR